MPTDYEDEINADITLEEEPIPTDVPLYASPLMDATGTTDVIQASLEQDAQGPGEPTIDATVEAPNSPTEAATTPPDTNPQPAQTSPAEGQPEGEDDGEEPTFGDYAIDALKGVVNGPFQAAFETADLIGSIVTGREVDSQAAFKEATGYDLEFDTQTGAGRMTQSISSFITGFAAGGAILKTAKVLQGAGKMATAARGMAKSAYSSGTVYDGHEERLSNLVNEFDSLRNPVTEYLAADKDDDELEGRIKNVLEDLGVGVAAEFLLSLKYFKKATRAKTAAERDAIMEEGADALEAQRASQAQTPDAIDDVTRTTAGEATPTPTVDTSNLDFSLPKNFPTAPEKITVQDVQRALGRNVDEAPSPRTSTDEAGEAGARETPNPDNPQTPQTPATPRTDAEEAGAEGATRTESVELTDEVTEGARQLAKEITEATDRAQSIEEFTEKLGGSTLFKKVFAESQDGLNILIDAAENMQGKLLRDNKETWEQLSARAMEKVPQYGGAFQKLMQDAAEGKVPLREASEASLILTGALDTMARRLSSISHKIIDNEAAMSPRDWLEFIYTKKNIDSLYTSVENLGTYGGRFLNSRRMNGITIQKEIADKVTWYSTPTNISKADVDAIIAREGWTQETLRQAANDVYHNADDSLSGVIRNMRERKSITLFDMAQEWRINGMLSGPVTHAINLTTSAIKTLTSPAERFLGGTPILNWSRHGNAALRQEAMDIYAGFLHYAGESFAMAMKALRGGDAILDTMGASRLDNFDTGIITRDNVSAWLGEGRFRRRLPDSVKDHIAGFADIFGRIVRIPSRLMLGTDEFFKQLNYRSQVYASLRREGRARGFNEDQIAAYVDANFQKAFDEFGGAVIPQGGAEANQFLRYSRQQTWTQDLGQGTLMYDAYRFINQHPSLKIVMPFVKTPSNIIRDFAAHTPGLNFIAAESKAALAQGGEAAQIELAKMSVGIMTATMFVSLGLSGHVTGSPPKDRKLREHLMNTGWRPYSFKIGDKYVEYKRIDPFAMMAGIGADIATAIDEFNKDINNKSLGDLLENLTAGIAFAVKDNVLNKTYMQGLSDFMNCFFSADNEEAVTTRLSKYIGNTAASFVPFTSLLRFGRYQIDDSLKELRGMTDYMVNALPGFSESLPTRYNWVDGTPVHNTGLVNDDKRDAVFNELYRIATGIQTAPIKTLNGIEMTAEQYSRLCELHGTVTINGRTLYEALENLFDSPQYDINRDRLYDPPEMAESPRSRMVRRIIGTYRKRAQQELLDEYPDLAEQIRMDQYRTKMTRSGAMTRENEAEMMQQIALY